MKTTYAPFDAAEYLDSDEAIAEYLTATLEDGNPDVFLAALGDVAKARGRDRVEFAEVDRPRAWRPSEEEWSPAFAPKGVDRGALAAPTLVPSPALAPGEGAPIRKVGIH